MQPVRRCRRHRRSIPGLACASDLTCANEFRQNPPVEKWFIWFFFSNRKKHDEILCDGEMSRLNDDENKWVICRLRRVCLNFIRCHMFQMFQYNIRNLQKVMYVEEEINNVCTFENCIILDSKENEKWNGLRIL